MEIVTRPLCALLGSLLALGAWGLLPASAHGARYVRGTTRTAVNTNVVRAGGTRDVNVHRDIDVDVDHDYRGYAYPYHPGARAAAATAAVAVTAVAIGTVVSSLPPGCSAVTVDKVTYQQCGETWYQPRYAGTQLSYVVVNPPR